MKLRITRIYEEPSHQDGTRILVDRVWPRGMSKDKARVDHWLKEIAPSTGLRKWFGHDPDKWDEFRERYFEELDANPEAVDRLVTEAGDGTVTLVYSARDENFNNAVALKAYLEKYIAQRR